MKRKNLKYGLIFRIKLETSQLRHEFAIINNNISSMSMRIDLLSTILKQSATGSSKCIQYSNKYFWAKDAAIKWYMKMKSDNKLSVEDLLYYEAWDNELIIKGQTLEFINLFINETDVDINKVADEDDEETNEHSSEENSNII